MSFKNSIKIILCFITIVSCKNRVDGSPEKATSNKGLKRIIEAEELLKIQRNENLVIVDFRKKEEYKINHIKGALNIWRTDIEDATYAYGGMMAKKEHIESLFSKLGIRDDDTIVVYDNKGSSDAARLWWLLKYYGFESVQLLNGGFDAWKNADGDTSHQMTNIEPSMFAFPHNENLNIWISYDELLGLLNSTNNIIVLDTRSSEEFTGKRRKKGAVKAGRIPKSIHIDWANAIDYHGTKKFKTKAELEVIYGKMNASKNDTIIVYCHTGVRSAHTTFVLKEILGYKNVRNYDGSWTEWSQFNTLPFEKDSITIVNK
ncbi:sulfurtransferase [Spongiivirga citrea]|uniref:Sulfurtransferase n=1 Tax=Spongiivirga citrea TaxID=1481457 RepID=A0A6M0CIR6_9FLAO|nr:sulfurtransferase [Spongiivirga citrea]NER15864.1 sulfurtransferase [Spongiivirga citrea]